MINARGRNMYKIAICEDNKDYITVLKKLILSTNIVDMKMLQFYEFMSGEQIICEQKYDFDLVIMDIQLAQMDGYETAMKLRQIDNNFLLVFCSGVFMPAPRFFKANVFRYLQKSDSQEIMRNEMTAIVQEMVDRKDKLYIMCKYGRGKEQLKVYVESVQYIVKRNGGSTVIPYRKLKEEYSTEILWTNMDLDSLEEKLGEPYNFVRIHNSYLVHMAYIMKITPYCVELVDGTTLTVSRSRRKYFREKFAKYVAAKYGE